MLRVYVIQLFQERLSFQAYALLRLYIQMHKKWLYGPEKFPGLLRNGPQCRNISR